MSTKYHRAGGKFNGNHTTLIPVACLIADVANTCPQVTKISPGFIKAGLRAVSGHRRLKIAKEEESSSLLLSVRDNASHQEIRVYTNDLQKAMEIIARGARDHGIAISFKE